MVSTFRCAVLGLGLVFACTGGIDLSGREQSQGGAQGSDGNGQSEHASQPEKPGQDDSEPTDSDDDSPGTPSDGDGAGAGDDGANGSNEGNGENDPGSDNDENAGNNQSDDQLTWRSANLTNYESYPEPGSEECIEYSGCKYAGYFAAFDDQQSEEWVMSHNIAAVHLDDFDEYEFKTLRLRNDGQEIDVVVYDACNDADCDGCCSENASETGFLIDLEKYTAERFGTDDGIVEWACVDC
jgi:hypothetical protein